MKNQKTNGIGKMKKGNLFIDALNELKLLNNLSNSLIVLDFKKIKQDTNNILSNCQ